MRELLPPLPRVRGPSRDDFESEDVYAKAQTDFKVAVIQEKAAYKVWFKCVGRNKYAMFDEVARERGTWDDLCLEPPKRAFARRGLCKPCKKYYDDSKGLEAHEKRHHPRPPSQDKRKGGIYYGRKMFQMDKMHIYKLQRGQNHSWSSKIGIWGIFREKGLIREIGHIENFTPRDGSSA